jgi:hypothetical protein
MGIFKVIVGRRVSMSHCCGGCGGEDPSKKKAETSEKDVNQVAEKNSASANAEKAAAPTGTWQPAKE